MATKFSIKGIQEADERVSPFMGITFGIEMEGLSPFSCTVGVHKDVDAADYIKAARDALHTRFVRLAEETKKWKLDKAELDALLPPTRK